MNPLQPNACTVCAKKYATHMRKSCHRWNRLSAGWENLSTREGKQSRGASRGSRAEQGQDGGRRSNSLKSIKRQERKSLDYQTGDTLPFCASLAAAQIYGQKCVRKGNNSNNITRTTTTTLVVLELVFFLFLYFLAGFRVQRLSPGQLQRTTTSNDLSPDS